MGYNAKFMELKRMSWYIVAFNGQCIESWSARPERFRKQEPNSKIPTSQPKVPAALAKLGVFTCYIFRSETEPLSFSYTDKCSLISADHWLKADQIICRYFPILFALQKGRFALIFLDSLRCLFELALFVETWLAFVLNILLWNMEE